MKKVYLLCFLLIIGLSFNVPIDCMFARLRSNVLNWRVAGRSSNSSTFSGRFKSWLQSFQNQPKISPVGNQSSAPDPFRYGQKRFYSTTDTSSYDKERILEIFHSLEDYCQQYTWFAIPLFIDQSSKVEAYPYLKSKVNELASLMNRTIYNPLNDSTRGFPKSFFFRWLYMFFRSFVDDQCHIYRDTDELVSKIIDLGVRYSEKETIEVLKESGMDARLRKKMDDISTFTETSKFKDIQEYASLLMRWNNFFKGIDFDIDSLSSTKKINWEKMEQIAIAKLNNPSDYNQPIYSIKDNADVLYILKDAGFSNISIGKKEITGFEDDSARSNIRRLLGLSSEASDRNIQDAYNKFVRTARSDVTQDITGPLYIKWKVEVEPVWDAYNKELQKEREVTE